MSMDATELVVDAFGRVRDAVHRTSGFGWSASCLMTCSTPVRPRSCAAWSSGG